VKTPLFAEDGSSQARRFQNVHWKLFPLTAMPFVEGVFIIFFSSHEYLKPQRHCAVLVLSEIISIFDYLF
jgi:hypothetical protein